MAALIDPMLRAVVLSLTGRARSAGEVAAELDVDLKRLHHHLQKLCRLGLVEVAGERQRPGRPIKLYRATSTAFLVPHAAAPELFTEELARELREGLAAEAHGSGGGILFGLDRDGQPLTLGARGPRPARATETWSILRLTDEDLAALAAELAAVFARFSGRSGGRGEPYLVHAAAAPKRDAAG